ncbi:uncharacterized protein LOC107470097 [Arachis duranensis]|uniref:Uncharacterized protein LOC107470097 n=1 Tax=Arachis duranensis TaxID=130453 RepID=A0A6P4BS63_ARADU|nr:uncharacterized protein LOC107470097 [Arachis duranensis]
MKGYSSCVANTQNHVFLPSSNANNPRQQVKVGNLWLMQRSHGWSSLVHHGKGNENGFVVVGCASWNLKSELERDLEDKEHKGMARFRYKCGERKGVVELLECLEKEAIMGEDVGKDPMDYNRRAQIFDRSSRVFQALKEANTTDVVSQP